MKICPLMANLPFQCPQNALRYLQCQYEIEESLLSTPLSKWKSQLLSTIVWWHQDIVHTVESHHGGEEPNGVFYTGFGPDCQINR